MPKNQGSHSTNGRTSASVPNVARSIPDAMKELDERRRLRQVRFFDAVVVGGGPSGATAASQLAKAGHNVMLLDKAGRIKPCGGAIPPRLIRDYDIPNDLICARVTSARIVSPKDKRVDMPINGGFVGMVDRDVFDEWLRNRAVTDGATRITGTFKKLDRDVDGVSVVHYETKPDPETGEKHIMRVKARAVIGADGAKSMVAKNIFPNAKPMKCVFAYHEIIESPSEANELTFHGNRCDVYYQGKLSPDFYAWVFPHGKTASIGVGSAHKGFSLRGAVRDLRQSADLHGCRTVRHEGAPIPLKPRKKWDNGRDVILAGDAAGVVAPASGEGIYYAMYGGELAAMAVDGFLKTRDARALSTARKQFMKAHGRVFWVLGILQHFWYGSDNMRERFVKMCDDPDVQRLTWESYMNKELVRKSPMAHVRVFFKDVGHLLGVAKTE